MPLPASPLAQSPKPKEKPQLWKMSCLRPAPPTRPTFVSVEPGSKRNSMNVKNTNANKKGKQTQTLIYFTFCICLINLGYYGQVLHNSLKVYLL